MKHFCALSLTATRNLQLLLAGLALAPALIPSASLASGIVANCTDFDLRAAVTGGGTVTFGCDGVILLTNALWIGADTHIDAAGRNVVLSGGNSNRLFVVLSNATLSLHGLSLVDGLALGSNGSPDRPGEPGCGGAICNSNGIVNVIECGFLRHQAKGGEGGAGTGALFSSPGAGGAAAGGAIYNWHGSVYASNCVFESCRVDGGAGGVGPGIGVGGVSTGGAICNVGGTVHLAGVTLSNNVATGGRRRRHGGIGGSEAAWGGAVYNSGDLSARAVRLFGNSCFAEYTASTGGGAIYHEGGVLSFVDSSAFDNRLRAGAGLGISSPFGLPGGSAFGGGLYLANGSAHITNSTLAGNTAVAGRGPGGGSPGGETRGGGIFNAASLFLVHSTVAHNVARGGDGSFGPEGSGYGGGLNNEGTGTAVLIHATIAHNRAEAGLQVTSIPFGFGRGGGLFSAAGTVSLRNTIVAHSPAGTNGLGVFMDEGHNISSDGSLNFTTPGSFNNADPRLGPLADYGGPTLTMALLAGSPAFDAADTTSCPGTDQRGIARPFGAGCDIGAFESAPPYTILGRVDGFTTPVSGIQVAISSDTNHVAPAGQIAFHGLAAGSYPMAAASAECVFVPRSRSITVGPDVVDANFYSYRSNALVLERIAGPAVRGVFAAEAGSTYHVLSSTDLSTWNPWSTNTAEPNGLFEFINAAPVSLQRYFQVVRP